MNNVIFRTTSQDKLDKGARILIELVVYVKSGRDKITEMSCGWCELPVDELTRGMTHKLEIHGGTPTAEVEISNKDVRNNRSGINFVKKVFTNKNEKMLEIEVTPYIKQKDEVKYHMDMLPSTCLVHKTLLHFATGFMNYKAEKLLRETAAGNFRVPPGDAVLSCFSRIFDCPDIIEEFNLIWG